MFNNIGIDLGTSSTIISINKEIKHIIPSIIYIDEKEILIGDDAKIKENRIENFKRLICIEEKEKEKYKYINNIIHINTNKGLLSIIEIIGLFLTKIKEIIKIDNYNSVITIPAYFNEYHRKIVWESIKFSEIKCLKLLSEPISACIAFNHFISLNNKNVLIIDFGAGTLDLSIIKIEDDLYEVLSIYGNNNIGGIDINKILINELKITNDEAEINKKNKNNYNIYNKFLKNTFISCIHETISRSKLDSSLINNIILVGGTCKLKWIKNIINKNFNIPIININKYKLISVSLGACIHLDHINNKSIVLLDRIPYSIGVKTINNTFTPIIYKGSIIPLSITKIFTSDINPLLIEIYQGESDNINDNIFLRSFELVFKHLNPVIYITIKINHNAIIEIIAKERFNDTEYKLEIK